LIERLVVATSNGDLRALGNEKPGSSKPMPLLPPVLRGFLPVSFFMPLFCGTGIRYDARHAYGLMTNKDGGCKNNYAGSRTFKRSAAQFRS